MRWLMYLGILGFLFGCADSSTTGNINERDQKQDIVINNSGDDALAVIYFPIYYASDTDSVTKQETAGSSNISPKGALGYQGTGALEDGGGEMLLEGITTSIRQWQDYRKKDSDNPITTTTTETITNPPTVIPPKTDAEEEDDVSDFSLKDVEWLHTDVSKWRGTAILKSVSTTKSTIRLDYDKTRKWPGVHYVNSKGQVLSVNANPWIFVKKGNKWYGATWEWMKIGQTSKSKSAVAGDHINKDPLKNFKPQVGKTYGFMLSGLARDHHRNVEERTNVVMFKWE